jgi:hypothetical protein
MPIHSFTIWYLYTIWQYWPLSQQKKNEILSCSCGPVDAFLQNQVPIEEPFTPHLHSIPVLQIMEKHPWHMQILLAVDKHEAHLAIGLVCYDTCETSLLITTNMQFFKQSIINPNDVHII